MRMDSAIFFRPALVAKRRGRAFGSCGLIQWHCHWIKPQIQIQETVSPGGDSKGAQPLGRQYVIDDAQ
jgi:hypothetical protein